MSGLIYRLHAYLALVALTCSVGMAANQVTPGSTQVDSTFEHLGIVWWISDDDDLDSTFQLEFRRTNQTEWRQAAPPARAYPSLVVNGAPLGLNYWAASALFLQPGQSYDLRLSLTDPDGGGEVRILASTTRTQPPLVHTGRDRYVVPGNGGGSGSPADPFQGLQEAADGSQPGDVLHIAAGIYSPFRVLTSGTVDHPIVFRGPDTGVALVEGADTDRGIVTLGNSSQTLSHIVIENLTLENGRWGFDAQHTSEIVIRHNTVRDVDYGAVNRRGDGVERNQTICDNVFEGRVAWPGAGIPSQRGIDLRGYGNVVCHNRVRFFGDCVSIQPFTGPSFGNDVFGNDASYCVDDGIEIDYNQANARVWRNRVMNSRMGVSVQPIRGGPAYIFRNELFNLESVPIKMHNETTGFLVVHNTGAKHGNGHGDNGAMWRNAWFRNNLFLGTGYAFEFTTVADEGFRDFDFNAWGTTREIGGDGEPYFKWDRVRYDRLVDLQAIGVEIHGVEAEFENLIAAELPPAWDQPAEPGSRDLRLVGSANAVDAGALLDNLNDPFPTTGPPDIGAFELGQPLPPYGPRSLSATPVFSDDFESGDTARWDTVIE